MPDLKRWSKFVIVAGGVSLVVGSFDPLEGSLLILPGSALLALGSHLGHGGRRIIAYRTWSFVFVAFGVASLFSLSAIGGVGGPSGHSAWWALLILPYLVGWSIDLWGPGTPRWLSAAGVLIGAWYVGMSALILRRAASVADASIIPAVAIGAIGIVTLAACAARLFVRAQPNDHST